MSGSFPAGAHSQEHTRVRSPGLDHPLAIDQSTEEHLTDAKMSFKEERRSLNTTRPASYSEHTLLRNSLEERRKSSEGVCPSSERRTGSSQPAFLSVHSQRMRLASEVSIGSGMEGHPAMDPDNRTGAKDAHHSTPLDRTIDAIGMGRYQYAILILSGLGWAADNMWLQGVAIVLPRVQDEWGISDRWIGLVSSSTFAGMMIGAIAWGSYSDTFGRKNAFNITLVITSIFGLLSSLSPSFPLLCVCLFLLGTGVGGSMPTDGTIFLEALPKRHHYLLTALSVFFAGGSVVTSLLALILVPTASCGGKKPCEVHDNKGWRYLLIGLGVLTLMFVIARLVFFTLWESPKYLVSAGKHEEARDILQRIAAFNGDPKKVRLSDVTDSQASGRRSCNVQSRQGLQRGSQRNSIEEGYGVEENERLLGSESLHGVNDQEADALYHTSERWPKLLEWVPSSWRPSLREGASRYAKLFEPKWKKTTILVWSIWTFFTLAYTMVNVFLPKYLESRTNYPSQHEADPDDTDAKVRAMQQVMQEFLFYSLASLPGSLMGAYLIETHLGRIKSMALSTTLLAISLLCFAFVTSAFLTILTSCAISLFASVSYAVIYSYSPEVFDTNLRGTASGTASALSRMAGILAPILAGGLMQLGASVPLILGFFLFGFTVCLQLSLPYETRKILTREAQAI